MKPRIVKEFAAHPNQEKRSPIFDEVSRQKRGARRRGKSHPDRNSLIKKRVTLLPH
jgi:hypothetical protein